MAFNADLTEHDMIAAAQTVMAGEWPKVKDALQCVIKEERAAFDQIAAAYAAGKINDEDLKSQLEDEKETFTAGLAMVHAVSAATVQKAVNAALDILWKAVTAGR